MPTMLWATISVSTCSHTHFLELKFAGVSTLYRRVLNKLRLRQGYASSSVDPAQDGQCHSPILAEASQRLRTRVLATSPCPRSGHPAGKPVRASTFRLGESSGGFTRRRGRRHIRS